MEFLFQFSVDNHHLGLRRKFQWVFVEAAVQQPILGADFLKHFNLLVDLKHKQLID